MEHNPCRWYGPAVLDWLLLFLSFWLLVPVTVIYNESSNIYSSSSCSYFLIFHKSLTCSFGCFRHIRRQIWNSSPTTEDGRSFPALAHTPCCHIQHGAGRWLQQKSGEERQVVCFWCSCNHLLFQNSVCVTFVDVTSVFS